MRPLHIRDNGDTSNDGLSSRGGTRHGTPASADPGQAFLRQRCGHSAQRQRER